MLYRPCLIKLIDPDNPTKWEYHLREQKLPFFITLAHEFLHALNQLECVDWLIKKNEGFSNPKNRLQEFLMEKLELKPDDNVLQEKYKIFWKNPNFDDSLDEMTVILQSKRKVALGKVVCIGESTFLQEFYDNDSIISWSHFSARDNEFWEKMHVLLEKDYINKVFGSFDLKDNVLYSIYVDYAIEKFNYTHYKIGYSSRKSTKQKIQKIFFLNVENLNNILIILETPDGKREVFVQWNWDTIRTLPKYIIIDK